MLPPIDYHDDDPRIIASLSVLALLATIAVILRFWTRRLTQTALGLDDYIILTALILQQAQSAAAFAAVIGGGLGRDFQLVVAEGKVVFLFKVVYGLSAPIVKLSSLAFIWRIFPTRVIKIAVSGIFLLGGITLAASLTRTISTAVIHNQTITNFTKQFVCPAVATVIEVYVGIVGACVPVLTPVYHRIRGRNPPSSSASSYDKKVSLVKGLNYNSMGNGRRMARPYDHLDNDLSTVVNNSRNTDYQVEISRTKFDGLEVRNNHHIPLKGIRVERDTQWTESKSRAQGDIDSIQ
ncbi:hypothetical protein F4808DRAFT_454626 [Astrocystis sublimbata]|nr:hypothetical protein F4808DRAFT_454626 [Astrocystis sublimbata]